MWYLKSMKITVYRKRTFVRNGKWMVSQIVVPDADTRWSVADRTQLTEDTDVSDTDTVDDTGAGCH